MGIIRDSFIVFKNWAEAINKLPEKYQLEAYKALTQYGLTGIMPEKVSPYVEALLISFSVGMENSICRYTASVENGKKGGRPSKNQGNEKPKITQQNLEKPNKTQEEPKITKTNLDEPKPNPYVYVNDNVNYIKERDIERKKEIAQFFSSLSQKYPLIEQNTKNISASVDLVKLEKCISQSEFLKKSPLSFILQNYDKVIANCYKTIAKENPSGFKSRRYTDEELNTFDNLDEVNL